MMSSSFVFVDESKKPKFLNFKLMAVTLELAKNV